MQHAPLYHYDWIYTPVTPPLYNNTSLLAKIQHAWLTFVGDSLSRNTYHSLACLLHGIPYQHIHLPHYDEIRYYPSYNATIARMWSCFLVMPDVYTRSIKPTRPRSVPDLGVDVSLAASLCNSTILVLGTGGWWGDTYRPLFWPSMAVVFEYTRDFAGIVVFHLQGRTSHYPCHNTSAPLTTLGSHPRDYDSFRSAIHSLQPRYPHIRVLETELLSEYRIDAHPSSTPSYRARKMDCQHWILPGVPDTWNSLLFSFLL
jgi:hypothetical protein